MDYHSLEIRLISCSGLKTFNFFKKLLVYAVVSIVKDGGEKSKKQKPHLQRQKTLTNKNGGKNPEWNHTMEFGLEELSLDAGNPLFLKFDLRSKGIIDRSIGEVRVPLKEMLDEFNGPVRYPSYKVSCSDGKPKGVLKFSYKLNRKAKTTECDSSHVNSSPRVQYPSAQVHTSPKDTIQYPSLNNIAPSLLPSLRSSEFHLYPWHSVDTARQNRLFLDSVGCTCSNGLDRYLEISRLERLDSHSWKLGPRTGGVYQQSRSFPAL